MAVKEWRGSILFLHRVADGPADHSYGIHVAQLAGVPDEVCGRAEEILANIERHELKISGDPVMQTPPAANAERINQLDLFRAPADEISDRLRRLDIDGLTPREALELLAELHEKVHEKN
jgi:DNA mismatch repair protein MutS